jgi:phosphate transport system permease protein
MSDLAAKPSGAHDWGSEANKRRIQARYRADRRLRLFGLAAIGLAILLLGILVGSLVLSGYKSFVQSKVELPIFLDPGKIDAQKPAAGNYRVVVRNAIRGLMPNVTDRKERRALERIFSSQARFTVRDYTIAHPDMIGQTVTFFVPLSDPFDQLNKDVIPSRITALSAQEVAAFRSLEQRGVIVTKNGSTSVRVDAFINPASVNAENPVAGNYAGIANQTIRSFFMARIDRGFQDILAGNAADVIRGYVAADPDAIGQTVALDLPVSPYYAQLAQGETPMMINPRFASAQQVEFFEAFKARGLVSTPFNWELFFNSDSRFPEQAGLAGAIVGSFYTLLVCFLISFPMGISAAVYLEEFAPKNRITDIIEVNINNLAAVPSVVFGLLGLALFLNVFGMPRSAPLVGGMVLSLMTLPTIIIATRAALKAVPPSIREAALGVGASKHQVVMHHVLPLAMPGILTGTIIGLAQALGETAPLLLIGMNAFITSAPGGILEPATSLPTQIFSWADSPERGFVSRTSAAILVLLGFLVVMNAVAIFLRQRFESKW